MSMIVTKYTHIFSMSEIKLQKDELDIARARRQHRAAFGCIIRDNIVKIMDATNDQRAHWLRAIDVPASYTTEVSKEIALFKYAILRGMHP